MRTGTGVARKSKPQKKAASQKRVSEALLERIKGWLDEAKAEDIVIIDLDGKSAMSDYMLIATGGSDRHVGAIADQLAKKLKEEESVGRVRVEGQPQCDWVLIDIGDIIVHVFRAEVREFYNLEKMWSQDRPPEAATH